MSNLLEVVRFHSKSLEGLTGKIPLMVDDISVTPDTAPYLVSSSKGLVWIEKAHSGDKIKAAIQREVIPGNVFMSVISEIASRGLIDEWGNVQPFTEAGFLAAVAHLDFYGLSDIEVLVPPTGKGQSLRPLWLGMRAHDFPVRPCSWLRDGWAVIVPKDRSFVGTLGHITARDVVVVVHNASRGVAILHGD